MIGDFFRNILRVNAKYSHTESRLENGELHVKKVVKTGEDAIEEIEKFKKENFDEIETIIKKMAERVHR